MSVASIDSSKTHAWDSQMNDQVDLPGPGVLVKSTVLGNTYQSMSGTNMATPHVSGVAAVVWSDYPSAQVIDS